MMLGPGRYRFSAEMEGEVSTTSATFAWSIECFPQTTQLGQIRIASLGQVSETSGFGFEVPTGDCPAQMLFLTGVPGEYPVRPRATIHHVEIKAAEP